jgi:hypothetical protein
MKKFVLFVFVMGFGLMLSAQTYFLQDFSSNTMPPAGWTIDAYTAQWSINNGNNAGGVAPEGMFTWVSGNGTSRLISPEVDLTGVESIVFEFSHNLDDYSGSGYSIGVATRSQGGNWNTVWEVFPNGNMGPETQSIDIDNGDVGQADFQICLYISGNFYNLDYWYVDNLWLFIPLDLDAGLTAVTTGTYLSGATEVGGVVKNFGMNNITDLTIGWQIDEGDVTTTEFSGLSIPFGQSFDFVCDGLLEKPIGSYTLKLMIESVNGGEDGDPNNDLIEKTVNVVSHTVQHRPALEEFTSSTCGPCASFNAQFVPWCNNHEEEITLVKYQMNWPGAGDPYYTAEGGVRRNQYGVSWVPWANLDGTYTDNNMSIIQNMFDASMLEMGLVNVAAAHTLSGTVMDIKVNMVPFTNITNAAVYIVVFEYITTGNVGNNGETEFHHVMMKMVPDASGTAMEFEDRMPATLEYSVDLAGTNVEDWHDLGVAVFVQDLSSLYIYQSAYTIEDGEFADEAHLSEIMIDGVPLEGFSPDVFDYTVSLELGTVEVPTVEVMTAHEEAMPIIVPTFSLPGATTIEVFAEDMATKLTYTIQFDIETGIGQEAVNAVSIFPNPTGGKVMITGVENADITVYNTTGAVMAVYNNFNSGSIDLSGLNRGMYFISIVMENNTILNKKINLLK